MDPINTYVFLNIEGTGLRDDEPDIEELSMIAVKRKKLLKGPLVPGLYSSADELYLGPEQCAKKMQLRKAFVKFMKPLKEPVCLVAFHGFKYHFPVLKSKLIRPPEFVCADAMAAFYDILDPRPLKSDDNQRLRGAFPWKRGRSIKNKKLKYDLRNVLWTVLGGDEPDPKNFGLNAKSRNEALIEAARNEAEDFVDWVDENNFAFSRVIAAKNKKKEE